MPDVSILDRRQLIGGAAWATALAAAAQVPRTAEATDSRVPPSPDWSRALAPGPDPTVKITEAYARMVARDAYFWAWPMVNIYNRRLAFKQAPRAGLMNGVLPMRRSTRW
jgi:hypothetical protein